MVAGSGNQQLVVDAINAATMASNAKQRLQHLEQLHELLVKNEPALLDEHLPHLVAFQVDKAASVRRRLVEFVTAAAQARASPAVIAAAAPCLSGLLGDEQLSVAKEAAAAAHGLLLATVIMLCSTAPGDAAAAAAWQAAQQLQDALSSRGGASAAPVAMRMAGIKMSEQAVLLYTSHHAQQLPQPASTSLSQAADAAIGQLTALLSPDSARQQPGPVVVCAMRALGTLLQQRPKLLATLLAPLLTLANEAVFKAPAANDGQSGVQASCGSTLRDVLVRVLRGNSEASKARVGELDSALRSMGAAAAADSCKRYLDKLAAKARGEKRKAEQQAANEGRSNKAARPMTPLGGDDTPSHTPVRDAAAAPAVLGGDFMAPFRPGAMVSTDVLDGAQQILQKLVEISNTAAIEAFLAQANPEILAELVCRWMHNLPPMPVAPHDMMQQPPGAAAVAAPMQAEYGGMMSLVPQQQLQQQQPQPMMMAVPPPAAALQQPPANPLQDPRRRAAAAAAALLPSPLPLPLPPEQLAELRTAAVSRILGATQHKPIRNFRELLLSRLVSRAPAADGLTDLMLAHVLEDYHSNRGHLLLIRWLYALAAAVAAEAAAAGEQQQQQQEEGPEGAAAAAAGSRAKDERSAAAAADEPMQTDEPQQQQDGSIHSSSSTRAAVAADLSGTPYEQVLLASLQGLQSTLPGTDPAIPRLLQEAPALPLAATTGFLQGLVAQGAEWALTALSTAQALFEARPPARRPLLQLLLDASVARDGLTRDRAVGLLVSKVMGWEQFSPVVVDFATRQLQQLLEWEAKLPQQEQAQQQRQEAAEAAAAAAAGEAGEPSNQQQEAQPNDTGQPQEQPGGPGPAAAADDAGAGAQEAADQEEPLPPLDVDSAAQHCTLFMSLCTLRPELLPLLLDTYAKGGKPIKDAMLRYAPSLAAALGATNSALLALVAAPPEGALELLAAMLLALTDKALPPKELATACAAHYAATGSVQLLMFALVGMTKADAGALLPTLLAQLERPRLRLLFRRLTSQVEDKPPLFPPVELLVRLHTLLQQPAQQQQQQQAAAKLTAAQLQAAVDIALHAPETFNASTVMTALQRLEVVSPLPPLFMRSVISLMRSTPALLEPILELLKRLIPKQIWADKQQWRGFVIACKQAGHHAHAILLQLPPSAMEEALDQVGPTYSRDLIRRALSGQVAVSLYENVKEVLNSHMDKLLRDATAAAAAAGAVAGAGAAGGSGESTAAAGRSKQVAAPARPAAAAAAPKAKADAQQPQPVAGGGDDDDEFVLDFDDE